MPRLATSFFVLLAAAAPALAVGLGPLKKSGVTDNGGKAFYLTLINPYARSERYIAEPLEMATEARAARVLVFPAETIVAPNRSRQLLVIVRDLAPGETYQFRICAQRPPRPEETVHARVCSSLTARRLPARVRG